MRGCGSSTPTRSVMALVFAGLVAVPLWGCGLRRGRAGAGGGAVGRCMGLAMLIYFGALAFLPVALVAAGLFTAPIFVLLIPRFAYGQPIGPVQVLAVAVGLCRA